MARVRRVENKEEQERVVDDFLTRGYKIKHRGQYAVKLKNKDWGKIPTHVVLFAVTLIGSSFIFGALNLPPGGIWFVVIVANLSYAGYRWFTAEEIIIKINRGIADRHHPNWPN